MSISDEELAQINSFRPPPSIVPKVTLPDKVEMAQGTAQHNTKHAMISNDYEDNKGDYNPNLEPEKEGYDIQRRTMEPQDDMEWYDSRRSWHATGRSYSQQY